MYTIYNHTRRGKSNESIKPSLSLTLYPEKGAVVSTGELQNEASMEDTSKLNPFSGILMGISFNESLVVVTAALLLSHVLFFWEENLFGC